MSFQCDRFKNEDMRLFLNDIVGVCKKHKLSISHEDGQGGFIIEDFKEVNIQWLLWAFDKTSKKETKKW